MSDPLWNEYLTCCVVDAAGTPIHTVACRDGGRCGLNDSKAGRNSFCICYYTFKDVMRHPNCPIHGDGVLKGGFRD